MKELLTKLGWKKVSRKTWSNKSAIVRLGKNELTILKCDKDDRPIVDELLKTIMQNKDKLAKSYKPTVGENAANAIISCDTEWQFNSICATGRWLDKSFSNIAWGFVQSFVDYKFDRITCEEWQRRYAKFVSYINQIVKIGFFDLIFRFKVRARK